MQRRHSSPLASDAPQLWLRDGFVAVCEGSALTLHDVVDDDDAAAERPLLRERFCCALTRFRSDSDGASGRAANVLQGIDIRAGWVAGGTSSGLVLLLRLSDAPADGGSWDEPHVLELAGHSKVVACLCIEPAGER
eukprot:1354224-Prymnesium_polylepis.1